MLVHRALPALLALTVFFTACKKPAVESYRVAKETPPPAATPPMSAPAANPAPPPAAPTAATMANTAVPTASGADLMWTAPSTWAVKTGSAMRKGSYAIKGDGGEADLSITAFPGDVGGDLANINRWRGQIQLPPIGEGDLAAAVQRLERNGLKIGLVDLGGAGGAGAQRILGAIVPHAGGTWFFKLTGPDALVAKEKSAFTAFLDTIKPAAK